MAGPRIGACSERGRDRLGTTLMAIGWPGLDGHRPRGGRSGGRRIPLPVEGSRLERCYIETSGKKREMLVKVDGHVAVRVGVGGDVSFSSLGGVQQWLHAIDDDRVGLLIEPGDRPLEHDHARRPPHLAGRVPPRDAGRRGVSEADGHRRRADRVLQGAMTMKCPSCGAAESGARHPRHCRTPTKAKRPPFRP